MILQNVHLAMQCNENIYFYITPSYMELCWILLNGNTGNCFYHLKFNHSYPSNNFHLTKHVLCVNYIKGLAIRIIHASLCVLKTGHINKWLYLDYTVLFIKKDFLTGHSLMNNLLCRPLQPVTTLYSLSCNFLFLISSY